MRRRLAAHAFALLTAAAAAACGLMMRGTAPDEAAPEAGARPDAAPAVPDGDAATDAFVPDASYADVDAGVRRITFRQAVVAPWTPDTTHTASIDVTAGNLLLVAAYWTGSSTITVKDALGNTWVAADASPASSCSRSRTQIWYATTAATGSDAITVTGSVADGRGMILLEYEGVADAGALESASSRAAAVGSSTASAPDLTTSSPLDVIVAVFADFNGTGEMAPGAGFTARARDPDFYSMVEDNLPGVAPGSHSVTASLPAGQSDACWTGAAVAFKAK